MLYLTVKSSGATIDDAGRFVAPWEVMLQEVVKGTSRKFASFLFDLLWKSLHYCGKFVQLKAIRGDEKEQVSKTRP
jgi:hypothetical protein